MRLQNKDLYELQGGSMSASLLNAIARAANTILELGRAVGSAIRRMYSRNYC